MKLRGYFILMVFLVAACRHGNSNSIPPVADAGSTVPLIKIFGSDSTGYGYSIFIRDTEIIRQPHIPAINGLRYFSSKQEAERVALLVRQKMINGQFPPAVSVEEVDSLGVVY
jgi:hypothetical protein